ncbi:MAG: hypothetical protein H7099_07550 [Gemmatimonadaceae bacterium]|nr:hypothetical protein [Gemmatimonadaceae bacterium]
MAADSVLVGDSIVATVKGVNREGVTVALSVVVWSSTDSSVVSVSTGGVLRARNVGTVRVEVIADGVVGTKSVRIVPRDAMRVRVIAPDTAQLSDVIDVSTHVETADGVALTEVAPRFAVLDRTIATITPSAVGRARVSPLAVGSTTLLAIVGRDTTRRRIVLRLTPLRSLSVSVETRTLAVGDSAPYLVTAIDSGGRSVASSGTEVGVEPIGTMVVRNGFLVATGLGRVVLKAINGPNVARDTVTGLGPSEFPLEIVDGDGQNPLPLRMIFSMERVTARWRRIIRSGSVGEQVNIPIEGCRNRVPVAQFITGVRVLVRLDTLFNFIVAQSGPCAIRANGLPLLGTIQVNWRFYPTLSDRKLDDLLMHEVGHVLGIGSVWRSASFPGLVQGDTNALDPIFVGPNALAAFARLGGSAQFVGRTVPIEPRVLGHWRQQPFAGEVMAPSLATSPQVTSAVTVASLRDIGWNVEREAYDDYQLPASVLAGRVAPRVVTSSGDRGLSLEGDVLMPMLMILPGGRTLKIDSPGRPPFR